MLYADRAGAGDVSCIATLSTANNTESDKRRSSGILCSPVTVNSNNVCVYKKVEANIKTTFYCNVKTLHTANTNIGIAGAVGFAVKAKSLYL